METDVDALMRPFDAGQIRQRMGPGRKPLDYISGPDVIRRLLDATGNQFAWNVERVQLVTQDTNNGPISLWIVQGTLSVGNLGSRSGVGTHPADSAEAAKAAETDALKRAAIKFGVGLHLYEDDASNTTSTPQAPSPPPQQSGSGYGNGGGDSAYQRAAPGGSRSGNGYGNGNKSGYGGGRRNHSPSSYGGAAERDGVGENAPF